MSPIVLSLATCPWCSGEPYAKEMDNGYVIACKNAQCEMRWGVWTAQNVEFAVDIWNAAAVWGGSGMHPVGALNTIALMLAANEAKQAKGKKEK